MVNLELYRVFYTVAKCGSLTKAAEELYISQPAVSQAIKQLETQLTEAKEIIKNLLSAYTSYADSFDDRDNGIVAEAQAFLKE